jgi:hypothetical protein
LTMYHALSHHVKGGPERQSKKLPRMVGDCTKARMR